MLNFSLPALPDIQRDKNHAKLLQYAQRVWGIDAGSKDQRIDAALAATRNFFNRLGMTRLGEHGDIDLAVSRAILEAAL